MAEKPDGPEPGRSDDRSSARDGKKAGGSVGFGVLAALLAVAGFLIWSATSSMFGGGAPSTSLRIVSGSENKTLEPIVMEWARDAGVTVEMSYLGSVDISRALANGRNAEFDAVWPAHSLWIELGDSQRVVKHAQSIMRSPVVLGLRRSIAEKLGWVGRRDIAIRDILDAAEAGAFRLAMTSATQSNSGASAYLGFLSAMADNPDVLTEEHLRDESVRDGVRRLLGQVDRSSGSSGWLKDIVVDNPDRFDAMINYEALIIEANQALTRAGAETLYAVYPADGVAVADSPLGYVDRGDADQEEAFLDLQKHLLSASIQNDLVALGRRAGLLGLDVSTADPDVWNADWGVDPGRAIAPIPTPKRDVIRSALALYQTDLRKPSFTVWVLDVSGSMEGRPLSELKQAMALLLDPEKAAELLLQPSSRDVTVVLAFNHEIVSLERVEGDDPAALRGLLSGVEALGAGGGTDVYRALSKALEIIGETHRAGDLDAYLPAIVAMTDGDSDTRNRPYFEARLREAPFGADVPIHAIAFGKANEEQLNALAKATIGRLFDAKSDLAKALRSAKGYN